MADNNREFRLVDTTDAGAAAVKETDGIEPIRSDPVATESPSEELKEPKTKRETNDATKDEKPPSAVKRAWGSLGLDLGTVLMMAKGACSPVIGLALYQYRPFAQTFPTIGYLVAISAVIANPLLPRAKFTQTMVINVFGLCIGACVALLTCYCSVQARINTAGDLASTPQAGASGTTQAQGYNSSASVVSAIFLFFNILIANSLRFSRPQLQTPVILYSIFANVSGTFAPQFATWTQSVAFVKMLLTAFLAGMGISTVVSYLVFPITSRLVVGKQYKEYVRQVQKVLLKQKAYLEVMEHPDMLVAPEKVPGQDHKANNKVDAAAADLRASLAPLSALHAKIRAELPFAKREVAYGRLGPKDMDNLFSQLSTILLPLLGLSSIADIFTRIRIRRGWDRVAEASDDDELIGDSGISRATIEKERDDWNQIMQTLHDPFDRITQAVNEGLDHVLWVLMLDKPPKEAKPGMGKKSHPDVEAGAGKKPGNLNYAEYLEATLREFRDTRKAALRIWCSQRGITLEDTERVTPELDHQILGDDSDNTNRRQLYLILYLEYLLSNTARAVLDLVKFADSKVEDGTMKKKRLILPGRRRLLKWLKSLLASGDITNDNAPDSAEVSAESFTLGDAFHHRKDPEHLPPTNALQHVGEWLRKFTELLQKKETAFGFRVACATMSIAILAFLEQTHVFFVQQRIVWAMIMVAIGMTMTTGSGVFGFVCRVFGTFVAMCTSLVIWYIAGGRGIPGAVLPVLYCFCFVEMYILAKYPRLIVVGIITIVTQILIIGYELQADFIGVAAVSSNGQAYYPIYELAPFRLAAVTAGCAVAFIWTYFPYPITARTAMREQLGHNVYLLANYYSCVHTTVRMRLAGLGGDPEDKTTPAGKLQKIRGKVLAKILGLNAQLRQHAGFVPFEINLGGKFPRKTYEDMVTKTQHLVDYIALLDFSTRVWNTNAPEDENHPWFRDLKALGSQLEISSDDIIKLLTLISSSLITSTPLPPYLKAPKPYQLTEQINRADHDILGLHHILKKGYAAFAVTQVASRLIDDDLNELLKYTKELVGEVDFSFHIVSTASSSQTTLAALGGNKDKHE